ncbi:MAG TPA: cytochrome c oxidase subunit II [Methylomirabilota bacterium]
MMGSQATAAAGSVPTPSMFAPVSTPAFAIREVSFLVLAIVVCIFVVVAGLTAYAIVRYRRRPGDDRAEPPQVYGSTQIELAWTVVPFLIVTVLFLTTTRYIFAIEDRPTPSDGLEVAIVANQWWWEIRYPRLGIVTANELHVPVSDPARPTPTVLSLQSADVIHSFWIPQLAGKTDVIPGVTNRTWIDPRTPGTYVGQCAEFCGLQHAGMLLVVTVHPKEDFDRWVAAQQRPADAVADAREGRDRFASLACINCHTVRGTAADGVFGPDLTHLMSRVTLGAGVARNTPENLRAWVRDPAALKPGALMPAMKVPDAQVDQIVSYLVTLR